VRAAATRLVLNALLEPSEQQAIRDLQDWILRPDVADRILKHLALRGLARHTMAGWEPTLILRAPLPALVEG
jgi:hypothetical protein